MSDVDKIIEDILLIEKKSVKRKKSAELNGEFSKSKNKIEEDTIKEILEIVDREASNE